ncbi:FMN-binding protein [Patescibacteria group bacterium]|nr:FMN-binding protein [Patescibacteria group bacterium]MCL5409362.1 FMN-binding protein [Patescibacteria group bacterium]
MKKYIFSAFIVISFIVYALNQKKPNNDNLTQVVPTSPTPADTLLPSQTNQTQPTANPTPTAESSNAGSQYHDGVYTGSVADAYYGNIQVKVTISSGKISNVQFLDYPQDRETSLMINTQAMPYLKQEALQSQSAQVDIVSGATDTSLAFQQSLQSALSQASN